MTKPSGKPLRPFRSLADRLLWSSILPAKRSVLVLLAGIFFIPAGFAIGWGWTLFWLYNGVYAALTVVDLAMLPPRHSLRAERFVPDRVEQDRPFEIAVKLSHGGGVPISFEIKDDLPLAFGGTHPALRGTVGVKPSEFRYETKSSERGDFIFRYLYIRYWGGLGLWKKQARIETIHKMSVYPDLSGVRGMMSSLPNSLVLDGKKIYPKNRSGLEFHYIRDYTPNDDPRTVNWTASVRAGRLMANVRQPERGKIVTLLIDCGRLMGVELDGRVKLDRTIEAALVLAAVALRQGDQVAALVFSGEVQAYVPPGRGMGHMQTILGSLYNKHTDPAESHYGLALEFVMMQQRKRSLIVLFSDMENYLFEDELAPYLLKLRRSHPILLLSLEDPVLADWARTEVTGLYRAYVRSTAQSFRLDRKFFARRMAGMGIRVLYVPAGELALAAVNHYLELKSRDSL